MNPFGVEEVDVYCTMCGQPALWYKLACGLDCTDDTCSGHVYLCDKCVPRDCSHCNIEDIREDSTYTFAAEWEPCADYMFLNAEWKQVWNNDVI